MIPSMNKGAHGQGRINFASCIVTLTSRTPCTPIEDNEENAEIITL